MRGAAIRVAGHHDLRRSKLARVPGDLRHNLLALRRQRRLVGLEKHDEVARCRKTLRTRCKCYKRQSNGKLLVRGVIPVGAGGWQAPIFSGRAESNAIGHGRPEGIVGGQRSGVRSGAAEECLWHAPVDNGVRIGVNALPAGRMIELDHRGHLRLEQRPFDVMVFKSI
jgi:hypothetical protein